ncbi:unnamed protein product, partial [Ectocarpus sp. 12 AP-2014]
LKDLLGEYNSARDKPSAAPAPAPAPAIKAAPAPAPTVEKKAPAPAPTPKVEPIAPPPAPAPKVEPKPPAPAPAPKVEAKKAPAPAPVPAAKGSEVTAVEKVAAPAPPPPPPAVAPAAPKAAAPKVVAPKPAPAPKKPSGPSPQAQKAAQAKAKAAAEAKEREEKAAALAAEKAAAAEKKALTDKIKAAREDFGTVKMGPDKKAIATTTKVASKPTKDPQEVALEEIRAQRSAAMKTVRTQSEVLKAAQVKLSDNNKKLENAEKDIADEKYKMKTTKIPKVRTQLEVTIAEKQQVAAKARANISEAEAVIKAAGVSDQASQRTRRLATFPPFFVLYFNAYSWRIFSRVVGKKFEGIWPRDAVTATRSIGLDLES